MYVDCPSGHLPKGLVGLEGSMGHDGDAGQKSDADISLPIVRKFQSKNPSNCFPKILEE